MPLLVPRRNPLMSVWKRKKILAMHHAQRDYHFNKDSINFVDQLSGQFISVNRGVISMPSYQETLSRYHRYFSAVEFELWDDQSEPIIVFSDDGSMAFTVVDKLVRVNYPDDQGNPVSSETHFAWTAVYKKYGDDWKIESVASTERPQQ